MGEKLKSVPISDPKQAHYRFAVVTINNSEQLCKLADDFLDKAFSSVPPEYHEDMTKDGAEGDVDDIAPRVQDLEARAIEVLIQAHVAESVEMFQKDLFKPDKWYPPAGKKKKKKPLIVNACDTIHAVFQNVKGGMDIWYFTMIAQGTLECLIVHYFWRILDSEHFDINHRVKGEDGEMKWTRSDQMAEDITILEDFFGFWMDKSDMDEIRCSLLRAVLGICSYPIKDVRLTKSIDEVVGQTPDFDTKHLEKLLEKRGEDCSPDDRKSLVEHLTKTKAKMDDKSKYQAWAPWDKIEQMEQQRLVDDEEEDTDAAKAKKQAATERKSKKFQMKTAFEQADKLLENSKEGDMSLDDFLA